MYRKKQIIYTSHCVLNQNTVIRGWERASGAFNDILKVLLDSDIGIVQLPCPEFTYLGEERPPKTKEEYNTLEYRSLCKTLSTEVVKQMKEYQKHQYNIIGILGISESPSCDTAGEKGVFMEELFNLMNNVGLNLSVFDIPEKYIEDKGQDTVDAFRIFINSQLAK